MENTKETYLSMKPETAKRFKYWQTRTIIATMVGYAMFYFVRKNLSMAMPGMQEDLGITKADLGLFLTLNGLVYGASRFINGMAGDRFNARYFMVIGLVMCAICNIIFGFSSALLVFGIVWLFNGWFQGMGFPPCVRLLTHWVPPHQLATKMSIWNTSHSIGAGLAVIICGYVASLGWRWCFFVPSMIALLGAVFLWFTLRDTPSSVGLPEITSQKEDDEAQEGASSGKKEIDRSSAEYKQFVRKKVFLNPYIWILAVANFFVYVVRAAVLDWGPTLLGEWKGVELHHAGWMVAAFEICGILGMLIAGWATDKYFKGRGMRVCVFCMMGAALFLFLFWKLSFLSATASTVLLMAAGFFIYGPQALIGITAANLATNKAAATAAGFTGLFGYASAIVSGWVLGLLADNYGWHYAFLSLIAAGVIGVFVFLLGWRAKAHGYDD